MKDLLVRLLTFFKAWRERRDERFWLEWEELKQQAEQHNGKLLEIVAIRQHASTGTKAFAVELNSNKVEPVWAAGIQLRRGTYILATTVFRNGTNIGSHHNENFLHVRDIIRTVDVNLLTGWMRHNHRRSRS